MNWRIPLSDIDFGAEEENAVLNVLRSRWLTMGSMTQELERAFADSVGVKHAIAVTNGTAALHLACLAVGLGPGDEVIVPSLTFVATANAVRYTGAKPVFAEIQSQEDLNIAPESIAGLITERTGAILVVHYGGYACDMPQILALAKQHDLAVIEDAAHAVGSELNGHKLGTWGDVGCFSFFSNKNLTTGEGGMLVTNSDAISDKLRLLRSHGMTTLTWDRHRGHAYSYDVVDLGYNYRIDEARSALGIVQLEKLESNNKKRQALTEQYHKLLEDVPGVSIPFRDHAGISACHLMPILLNSGISRREIIDALREQGIQTSIHYPPIHMFSYYQNWAQEEAGALPLTEEVAARELTLPLYPGMSVEDVSIVVESIRSVVSTQ
jgi:dTDP-4-amino-4,6-dideoxygalactose transaminase